jgi:hypothetical protein
MQLLQETRDAHRSAEQMIAQHRATRRPVLEPNSQGTCRKH